MKLFYLLLSTCIIVQATNCAFTSFAKIPSKLLPSHSYMAFHNVKIKSVTLLARQETRPPLGIPFDPDGDIGFASVFLSIENSSEANAKLIIQKIEIRNAIDGSIQKFSQLPQEIRLHPLENSENVFHLTNKTGYAGQDKVKAVITYKLGSQLYVIESAPVEVERN